MSECKCGYTKDIEKNCDGTHKTVKKFKEDLIKKIDEIDLGDNYNQLNALGMKMMVKDLLK
jgi:hypothetical protein